jgi:hypothetical protein
VEGLGKYTVVPVEPALKAAFERALQRDADYASRSGVLCPTCRRHSYRKTFTPGCRHCCRHPADTWLKGYLRKGNGSHVAQKLCLRCGLREDLRRGETNTIADICIQDNTLLDPPEPCARCRSTTGTELHHWAPSAIFNDAGSWPTSWLCVTCHRTWHQAMRLAGGYRLPEDQRIGEQPAWPWSA